MHLEKQQALRRGHRSAIQKRIEEMEEEREDRVKMMTCLRTIERRLEMLKELDEKILEETEMEYYEEEITSAEDFVVSVEYRLNKMKYSLDSGYTHTVENNRKKPECQPLECERNDLNTNSTKSHYPSSHLQRLPLPNYGGNILDTCSRASASDPVMSTISHSAGLHSQCQQRQSVLLKTAVLKIKFENKCVDAKMLMDEGAQRSFISRSLADRLELRTDEIDTIHLTAFGDPAHSVKHLEVATVNLIADNGDLIPIRVLVVPLIAEPTNIQSQWCAASHPHLQGLKLAHPVNADETFEISLLIGADYYWQIIGDKVVRGDGPTAVSSKIGYFLSGPLPNSSGNLSSSGVMDFITTHVADTTGLPQTYGDIVQEQVLERHGFVEKVSDECTAEPVQDIRPHCVKKESLTMSSADGPQPLTPLHSLNDRRLTQTQFSYRNRDVNNGGVCWHRWRHGYHPALREYQCGNSSKDIQFESGPWSSYETISGQEPPGLSV